MGDIKNYNEIYAASKNRVETAYLRLRLNQLEREQTRIITKTKKQIFRLEDELIDSIRVSTGTIKKTSPQLLEGTKSDLRDKNYYEKLTEKLDKQVERRRKQLSHSALMNRPSILRQDLKLPQASLENISRLKKADRVFAKRLSQLDLAKRTQKPLHFDSSDDKTLMNARMPRSVVVHKQRELVEEAKRCVSPRINPYTDVQLQLSRQVTKFSLDDQDDDEYDYYYDHNDPFFRRKSSDVFYLQNHE